jgi:transposase
MNRLEREARKRPEAMRLMTHPGVGPITALAYVLIIGTPTRFQCGNQIGTYVGMIPCEDSSARKRRLGHIGKHGSSLLRFLLVEAAQAAARVHPFVSDCAQPATCSIVGSLAASQERSSPAVRLYSEGRARCRNEKDQ